MCVNGLLKSVKIIDATIGIADGRTNKPWISNTVLANVGLAQAHHNNSYSYLKGAQTLRPRMVAREAFFETN